MKPGNELLFLALGGSGEIGMNVNLYGCQGKWVMVDLGLTFADPDYPGVDLVLPDLAFIEERRDDLLGIVLTHGHEDHIGAIPYLAARSRRAALRDAVHRRPDRRQARGGGADRPGRAQHGRAASGDFRLGPFGFRYIPLAHSIPEGNALLIDTPYGRIFHTGDWKLDDTPLLGDPSTEAELRAIGDAGVLALVCDSTNVFNEASSGSEARRPQGPRRGDPGRRLPRARHHLRLQRRAAARRWARSPQDTGRQVCVAGRSLDRILKVAKSVGYLTDFPEIDRLRRRRWSCRAAR